MSHVVDLFSKVSCPVKSNYLLGLERDLAALGDKIRQLDETANRLMQTHPEAADTIYGKQREINELWTQLTAKVTVQLYILNIVIDR